MSTPPKAPVSAPAKAALTPEQQAQVDAFVARITAPPPDTGKEGNEHWHSAPVGPNGERSMTNKEFAEAMKVSHEAAKATAA